MSKSDVRKCSESRLNQRVLTTDLYDHIVNLSYIYLYIWYTWNIKPDEWVVASWVSVRIWLTVTSMLTWEVMKKYMYLFYVPVAYCPNSPKELCYTCYWHVDYVFNCSQCLCLHIIYQRYNGYLPFKVPEIINCDYT